MQARGLKLALIEHKIIVAAADDYLDNHQSELLAEAKPILGELRELLAQAKGR